MSLHHGLTDLHDNHLTCFTDMLYSSMVPGNLPSQLEILSTSQNYYETDRVMEAINSQTMPKLQSLAPPKQLERQEAQLCQ